MRVATNTTTEAVIDQLQHLNTLQTSLQTQVSSGQRITKVSDDPASAARVLQLKDEQSQVSQFTANTETALETSQATYSALDALKTISDRASEIGVLGTSATDSESFTSYATEVNELIEQALQEANSTLDGDYLFAGTAVDTPAFSFDRDSDGNISSVSYKGNADRAATQISESSSLAVGSDGTTNAGLADFLTSLIDLRTALTNQDTTAVAAAAEDLTGSEDVLISAIAVQGALQTRIDVAQSQLDDRTSSLDDLVSSEVDADLTETVVKLSQAQTAYQAALQSASSIMSTSLLDYID